MSAQPLAATGSGGPLPRRAAARGSRATAGPARSLARGASETDYEALLLDNLEFIDRTVGAIARRNALSPWEADDLAGHVKLRLIADDYAIFRKFRGQSRITTYLTTVIQNLYRDFRIQRWGKWRPSAAAKRLGEVGVQLEALLYRDHFTFGEAAELLRRRCGVQTSDLELLDVAARLRPRTTRRFESDARLAHLDGSERGDRYVVDGELARAQERIQRALANTLASLESEERLLLRLRFADGLTLRAIAAALDLDQRRIYSRMRKLLRDVRERIVEQGIRCEEVLDLLDWPACAVEAGLTD